MKNLANLLVSEKKTNTKLGKNVCNHADSTGIDYAELGSEITKLDATQMRSLKAMKFSDAKANAVIHGQRIQTEKKRLPQQSRERY